MACPSIKSGSSTYRWDDLWNGRIPKLHFPELYSFTRAKSITLQKARFLPHLHTIFHIPLSDEAFPQFLQLQNLLANLTSTDENDHWTYIWGQTSHAVKLISI
jgi:hypothetical protein